MVLLHYHPKLIIVILVRLLLTIMPFVCIHLPRLQAFKGRSRARVPTARAPPSQPLEGTLLPCQHGISSDPFQTGESSSSLPLTWGKERKGGDSLT
eukprot:6002423-Pyramimonas_sp.AAC.1